MKKKKKMLSESEGTCCLCLLLYFNNKERTPLNIILTALKKRSNSPAFLQCVISPLWEGRAFVYSTHFIIQYLSVLNTKIFNKMSRKDFCANVSRCYYFSILWDFLYFFFRLHETSFGKLFFSNWFVKWMSSRYLGKLYQ